MAITECCSSKQRVFKIGRLKGHEEDCYTLVSLRTHKSSTIIKSPNALIGVTTFEQNQSSSAIPRVWDWQTINVRNQEKLFKLNLFFCSNGTASKAVAQNHLILNKWLQSLITRFSLCALRLRFFDLTLISVLLDLFMESLILP
ncbi:unnamed protein product [Hymenolepis diminuta]|uniref:Uncharacterized protein n=1 Tax=Hymenolepis diminuta TaxID=6216 RepID=A0A564Y106_HYMDI|nr:unnamed protein product [Hymenolepis diminuta]